MNYPVRNESRIETSDLRGLNKGFGSNFRQDYQIGRQTTEDGRTVERQKCYEYNNQDQQDGLIPIHIEKSVVWSSGQILESVAENFSADNDLFGLTGEEIQSLSVSANYSRV